MATVSLLVSTADTTVTPNTSDAYTPTTGSLQIAVVAYRTTLDFESTFTNSAGLTFTKVATYATYPTVVANFMAAYVADALTSNVSSQTVTVTDLGDPATGTIIAVMEVSGMTKVGLTAIRQAAAHNDGAFDNTPLCTFGQTVITSNPTIAALMNSNNPAGVTQPTGWTVISDIGHATPDTGQQVSVRDSGANGSSITWASTFLSAGCALSLELDASSSTLAGRMLMTGIG